MLILRYKAKELNMNTSPYIKHNTVHYVDNNDDTIMDEQYYTNRKEAVEDAKWVLSKNPQYKEARIFKNEIWQATVTR